MTNIVSCPLTIGSQLKVESEQAYRRRVWAVFETHKLGAKKIDRSLGVPPDGYNIALCSAALHSDAPARALQYYGRKRTE